jgi:hypothetical protein
MSSKDQNDSLLQAKELQSEFTLGEDDKQRLNNVRRSLWTGGAEGAGGGFVAGLCGIAVSAKICCQTRCFFTHFMHHLFLLKIFVMVF